MKSTFRGQTALGVSVDGRDMHLVRLGLRNKQYFVLDARTFTLNSDLNADAALDGQGAAVDPIADPDAGHSVELELEVDTTALEFDPSAGAPSDEEDPARNDAGAFMEIARLARGSRFSITLPEPQLFYTIVEAGAGQKGKKFEKTIRAELAANRGDLKLPPSDSVALLPMSEQRTFAVTRERPPRVLDELTAVKPYLGKSLPPVHALESFEISLVNLLLLQSPPLDDQITVILHIGHDSTRFIFLKGRELHHISQTIAEGSSSRNIAGIAASRLTFELDHLNFEHVDRVLLSGDACKVGIGEALAPLLPESVDIACLPSIASDLRLPEGRRADLLAPHSAALGSAMNALAPKREDALDIDLLPKRMRDAQNRWLITTPGWVMLLLIPLILFAGSWQFMQQRREITELRSQVYPMRLQAEEVEKLEKEIVAAEKELADFERSFSVIDSLAVDSHTWSHFLNKLQTLSNDHRYFWLTDVNTDGNGTAKLSGFSLYRETITGIVDDLRGDLTLVDVQEIRGKSLYHFEINTSIHTP